MNDAMVRPAMGRALFSSSVKRSAARAAGIFARVSLIAVSTACGTVLEPFEYRPDVGTADGSFADARSTDATADLGSMRDVGREDGRGGTGGSGGASGAAGTGNGGNAGGGGPTGGSGGATGGTGGATGGTGGATGGAAGAGGGAGTGGTTGGSGGTGGAGGIGGASGAGGNAGSAGRGGAAGAHVAVQGHIGAIGTPLSPIGNIRVIHQRISTSSQRLCNGAMCVTGGLTP